jgi:hypothetical protein
MQNSRQIIADSVEELGKLAPQRRADAGGSRLRLAASAHAQGAPKCSIYLLAMAVCAAIDQPGCAISMGLIELHEWQLGQALKFSETHWRMTGRLVSVVR